METSLCPNTELSQRFSSHLSESEVWKDSQGPLVCWQQKVSLGVRKAQDQQSPGDPCSRDHGQSLQYPCQDESVSHPAYGLSADSWHAWFRSHAPTLARKKMGRHFVDDLDSFTGWVKLCLVGSSHTMEIGVSLGAVPGRAHIWRP